MKPKEINLQPWIQFVEARTMSSGHKARGGGLFWCIIGTRSEGSELAHSWALVRYIVPMTMNTHVLYSWSLIVPSTLLYLAVGSGNSLRGQLSLLLTHIWLVVRRQSGSSGVHAICRSNFVWVLRSLILLWIVIQWLCNEWWIERKKGRGYAWAWNVWCQSWSNNSPLKWGIAWIWLQVSCDPLLTSPIWGRVNFGPH